MTARELIAEVERDPKTGYEVRLARMLQHALDGLAKIERHKDYWGRSAETAAATLAAIEAECE